jgi:hypothetical protein
MTQKPRELEIQEHPLFPLIRAQLHRIRTGASLPLFVHCGGLPTFPTTESTNPIIDLTISSIEDEITAYTHLMGTITTRHSIWSQTHHQNFEKLLYWVTRNRRDAAATKKRPQHQPTEGTSHPREAAADPTPLTARATPAVEVPDEVAVEQPATAAASLES